MSDSTSKQWLEQASVRTRNLQSGSSHQGALNWLLVQPEEDIPTNAVDLGSEGEPMYLCKSFYEDQLRVGRVTHGAEGPKAFIIYKGKEVAVKEYEILTQAAGFSFATGQKLTAAPPLPSVDIVFIVDDSDSMDGDLWKQVQNALKGIPPTCQEFDANGFDLFFLNNDFSQQGILDSQSVSQAFQFVSPDGETPTGKRLKKVLDIYLQNLESRNSKTVSIVVITDGRPSNPKELEEAIADAADRLQNAVDLSPSQLSIHFVQIGADREATDALEYLDNKLKEKYQIPDIVETTVNKDPQTDFDTETLAKALRKLREKQTVKKTVGSDQSAALVPDQTATSSGLVQNRSTAPTKFSSKKDWIDRAKQLTDNTLAAHNNASPFTWIFRDSEVPPENAIVVGKENEKDTFFVRSFYEGHLRYGTIASGASKAVVIEGDREVKVEKYEVLVRAFTHFYSFVASPSTA